MRRHRSERGAALAEFAICFPVFMLLMLAVVDMGVNYGDGVETEHAAEAAAHAGAVAKPGDDATCDLVPDGTLARPTRRLICLAKAGTHLDAHKVRVRVVHGDDDHTVVVCVQSRADSVSGMLGPLLDGKVHEARSAATTDLPSGASAPSTGGEQALGGHDWSFCRVDGPEGTDTA